MALCDPCLNLLRIFEEQDDIATLWEYGDSRSAMAFNLWYTSRDRKGSMPEALPQLPGLIHSTWGSFCTSLDSFCPFCWIVWRQMRKSPMASYHDEVHQKFYLWLSDRHDTMKGPGTLDLLYSHDLENSDHVSLWYKRTTKQRFEEVVTKTPLEEHMGSATTVETVKNWLCKCDKGHGHGGDGCVAKRRAVNKPTIPTRLIDVRSFDSRTWSLIETKNRNNLPKYVALSHRWTADTPRLLRSNYLVFQADQPDKALPCSYQDVFVLCRSLNIQYVWIDSLCIFQDSVEDFLHEAATMTEIYANAFCTFSICWEFSSGWLRPRDPRVLARCDTDGIWDGDPLDLNSRALSDRYVFVKDLQELHTAIRSTPVNRRGWVLQEQLLSPRVLYLGNDQFYWQCDIVTACETVPIDLQIRAPDYKRKNIFVHVNKNHQTWQDLVVQFMALDLTFERDRLLAISGIARSLLSPVERTLPVGTSPELHKKTEESHQDVEYVAGLQRAHWIKDLLWCPETTPGSLPVKKLDSKPFSRRPDNIVPSWSWAACPGPIEWSIPSISRYKKPIDRMPRSQGGPMADLRNINFEPLGSDVYGLPKSASLDISCLLVQARHAKAAYFYEDLASSTDQTKNMPFYVGADGFLLPLPFPRAPSDGRSSLYVILEPCVNIVSTCFIVPLVYTRTLNMPRIMGLVVQETPQSDSSVEPREFVRIGSFTKYCGLGADAVIHALVRNLPVEGDEFEQRLRDSARGWKEAENDDGETEAKGTAKAKWTTIRLV